MQPIIRKARKEDMKEVFQMIKELASHVQFEERVAINPEILENHGFSANPGEFTCFVAEGLNRELIGYILYYNCYQTFIGKCLFMEDLYVKEKYRGKGVGRKLLLTVAKIAYETSGRIFNKFDPINLTDVEKWDLAGLPKLEDQVKINHKVLEEDGFKQNPDFSCLVAESSDGRIVGYCLYFSTYSTWIGKSIFLEDLYIHPDFRGQNLGTEMFNTVAKLARDMNARMDFHVLSWNQKAADMYKKLGAKNKTDEEYWTLFRLGEDSLKKLFEK